MSKRSSFGSFSSKQIESFQEALLSWFHEQKRPLPWRLSYNPYHVWLSEIMLQQTQMERGVGYFLRWIERFPTLNDIAEAEEGEILKMWEGLGYYARARNLHRAAKTMVEQHGGEVPQDHKELLALPGVGKYTAAAIGSIACGLNIPVIDANVERIYVRLFDIEGDIKSKVVAEGIEGLAERLLPHGKARYWNQALMDLGGLVCTPKTPKCGECPVADYCLALKRGVVEHRPMKKEKDAPVFIHRKAFLLVHNGRVLVRQITEGKLWRGLYELPYHDGTEDEPCTVAHIEKSMGVKLKNIGTSDIIPVVAVKHSYTKYRVTMRCFLVELSDESLPGLGAYRYCTWNEMLDLGFSAGPRKLWEHIGKRRGDIVALLSS